MTHLEHDYAALMREHGFRVTPQREAILDAICAGGGHSTPDEIFERVHAKVPAINRATVYRTLDFLCELRLVTAMRMGGQTYYEIAGDTPHHHLVCRKCGHVEEIGHDTVASLFAKINREQNFTVDVNHLALFGLCAQCR